MQAGDIISHPELCLVEGRSLQHGMTFRTGDMRHSVLLMSQQDNARYPDRVSEDGEVVYYIGHDAYGDPNKSIIDQPLMSNSGKLTQNGRFFQAAAKAALGGPKEKVRIYEKIRGGTWVYNGYFDLINAAMENAGQRFVCVFELRLCGNEAAQAENQAVQDEPPSRVIPPSVKREVWIRDKQCCVICGAKTELHFDHIIPFSKGGTSNTASNIQLLCRRHNLEKSAKI